MKAGPSGGMRAWLDGGGAVSVIQDDAPVAAATIAQRADELAARLRERPGTRVALATQCVDAVFAALAACETARCQLLLLRESYPADDPHWRAWEVGAVLDDELRETPLPCGPFEIGRGGVLLMTSGTTGTPKVALHDLDRLLGRIRPTPGAEGAVRWLLTFHPASFAGLQVLLTALASRRPLIATSGATASRLTEAALRHRPTHISATPTFWRSFLLALGPRSRELPLRQITLGGEAVDQRALDELRAAFPTARVSHIYASTEAGALFAVKDGRAGFPARWLEEGIEGVQLRLRDGVLEVLSPRAMRSYLATASAEDGWIVTGDLVEVVGDRALFRGRQDDLINVGGAKVLPEQVESALLALPFIREARVYGIRNPLTGALVAADIVLAGPKPEEDARREITQALSATLEPYKVPRLIQFVFHIPINAVGKKARTP
jgi:acyl-coenzyme A synthetase/AMP-(fatty) acid ligase